MFNFHYPNVGMTEISNFGNTLKNDKPNDESILKITKCVYNDETYAIVKYNKENLTADIYNLDIYYDKMSIYQNTYNNSDDRDDREDL